MRFVSLSLVAAAVVGSLALGLTGQANAARPLSDVPAFYAARGLDVSRVPPIVFVGELGEPGAQFRAQAFEDSLQVATVAREQDNRNLVLDVAHEVGHYASFWRWVRGSDLAFYAYAFDEKWMKVYEEGLVEAYAEAVMPSL